MKVTGNISYVGANDNTIDLFESQYIVPKGISYNSYLIIDEKTAVMDTVDSRCDDEWLNNLKEKLEGRNVDYLVVSHVEPDHSGSILKLMEAYPDVIIVGNQKTFVMLKQFFKGGFENNILEVKEGDTLSLGSYTLQFFMAPMVHWPEVMVTYEQKEKVLFSADGFGKFGALSEEDEEWAGEARRYYFNIVGKYGAPVQALLKKAAGLDIKYICPLHGPVLKDNLSYYIDLYNTWSSYRPEETGVLVAYASIHGNTAAAAKSFARMLKDKGEKNVVVLDLARTDVSKAVEYAFMYDRMVLAAASYDGGVFPCMHDFLNHLQSKAYQKRSVAIIENGTWAPTAGRIMKDMLEEMKEIQIYEPVVTIRSSMSEENKRVMEELAQAVTGKRNG